MAQGQPANSQLFLSQSRNRKRCAGIWVSLPPADAFGASPRAYFSLVAMHCLRAGGHSLRRQNQAEPMAAGALPIGPQIMHSLCQVSMDGLGISADSKAMIRVGGAFSRHADFCADLAVGKAAATF
jgi:hypothetical protein